MTVYQKNAADPFSMIVKQV